MTLFRLLDTRGSLQNSSITCVKFRDLLLVNWNLLVNIQEYDFMLFLLQYLQESDTKDNTISKVLELMWYVTCFHAFFCFYRL